MRENGPSSVGEALQEFLDDLLIAGKSPATVRAYRYKLRARLNLTLPFLAFDRAYCRRIVAEEVRTKAPATAETLRGALGSFAHWATERGYCLVNPMSGVKGPRIPEPPVRVLNALALAKLREAAAGLDGCGYDVSVPHSPHLSHREKPDVAQESMYDTASRKPSNEPISRRSRPKWQDQRASGNVGSDERPRADSTTEAAAELDSEAARRAAAALALHEPSMPSHAVGRLLARTDSDPAGTVDLTARLSHGGSQLVNTHRLILSLLLGTGLRVSELAGARWADLEGDVLRVRSKGGRYRRVVVPPDALALLESSGRRQIGGTLLGMGHDSIYRRVKAIARRAGLPAVSPHWLRHAWATDYYRRGSLAHLQTLGGWRSDREIRARYAKTALEEAALEEARRLMDRALE